ncbi:tail fiber domain-containing protein [Bacillus cereus]
MIDQLDKLVQDANETASNAKKESEAAKTLAEKVQENIKNNTVEIIESKNPPTTGLKPFKTLWRDISNGKPGILKIWTGTAWESVVPDVESVKKETLDQVNKDIETTKTELNQKVQEAQNQATGQFNKVQEGLQGVSRTISNIENKQGEIDKKVTKFEQDSSGFKTSIESLTKKDGEISDKLSTVESTVEGTKKTISDVQQTTGELKQTTTEIKEQAGKITEKLTSVETKVNNDKAGGRNLLLDSNIKYEKTDYLINQYSLTENFFAGEEYTFVIKGSVSQGQKFGVWQNGGSNNVGYATSVYANGITYVTFKAVAATSGNERKLSLYNYPSNTTKAVVEWVALYKGNKPQDWTPAPENQVTTDEFTKKTTEIEKSVDGVKTTVTNVQNSQAGFEKRMSNVEQTASGLSSTVSNLNNVVSDQGKKLTEANTKLEQQATAIGAKVELKQVEDYVAGFKIPELKQTVNQNKQDLLDELANKLATEQFNQKMTMIDNRFTINEQGINAAAKKTEVYTKTQADGQFATGSYVRDMETRLQLTEKGVSISVKENDVIAAINMSKENIKLNAARIDLVGKVNAEWIKAGLLSGCQIRTSNTDNYVSLDDQFIRLYERGVARAFLGHYRRSDGAVQPTFILGSDEKTNAPEGTLFMSQAGAGWSGAYASIGISNGIVDGAVQKSVYWEMQRNGLSVLNANDYHVFYAGNGSWYFRRGKTGLYQTSLVVEDNSTESDLRLPNVTIRNSRAAGYTGVIQLKSSVTQNGWGAVQGNFMTPSLREYKSNIRDISFSALEKIRSLKIRQFNYKNAVNELYRMREEKGPNDPPLTTEDIKTYYGLIVDECDEMFVDESGKGIHLYSYASIAMKALQEVDATVQEQEIEIANLKSQVASQENRITRLEELLLQQLINKKPEQP